MIGRNEALEAFFMEHLDLGLPALEQIKSYSQINRKALGEEMEKAFVQLINRIHKAQENGTKEAIAYIHICFLRSNFYVGNGAVRIYAFDRRFALDPRPLWEDADFTGLCELLWKLEAALSLTLARYKNKVYMSDVRTLIQMEYIPQLIGRITAIAKWIVRGESITKCMEKISITDDFCVLSGEYQGDFEEILVTEAVDTKGLNLKECLNIHKKEHNRFCGKRYLEQTVDGIDLRGVNFTNSCFLKMDFSGCDFSQSNAMGTEWRQCRLINTCWRDAALFGSSFINSDLSGSDFSGIIAPVVPETIYFHSLSNLDGLCFHGSILRDVNFSGADLRGADFRGAYFYHTDFSGACLSGAMFEREALEQAGLSSDQKDQIRM